MNPNREELLFQLALTKSAAVRGAWLDAECAGDAALRQRLEALLAAHDQPDTLLATQVDRRDELHESQASPSPSQGLTELGPPRDAPDEAVGQPFARCLGITGGRFVQHELRDVNVEVVSTKLPRSPTESSISAGVCPLKRVRLPP
jgi:hypothetical protein